MNIIQKATAALVASFLWVASFSAQEIVVEYPYNPDADADSSIGVVDLMSLLGVFGDDFEPAELLIDDVSLLSILVEMQSTIVALQAQVEALEAAAMPELASHLNWVDSTSTFELSAANLQISNGLANNTPNGLGNLILGHNDTEGMNDTIGRGGSHVLVIGDGHAYSGTNGIVSGRYATLNGDNSAVISGIGGHVDAELSAILGGHNNRIHPSAWSSVIAGGETNSARASHNSIIGGQGNVSGTDSTDSRFSLIAGGRYNELQAGYCGTIAGGYGNTLEPDTAGDANQSRSVIAGMFNANRGSEGASIVGGYGSVLRQRIGHSGVSNLLIGTDAFLGDIWEENTFNIRVTGEQEEN
jgi:hypothetical protein